MQYRTSVWGGRNLISKTVFFLFQIVFFIVFFPIPDTFQSIMKSTVFPIHFLSIMESTERCGGQWKDQDNDPRLRQEANFNEWRSARQVFRNMTTPTHPWQYWGRRGPAPSEAYFFPRRGYYWGRRQSSDPQTWGKLPAVPLELGRNYRAVERRVSCKHSRRQGRNWAC